MTKDKFSELMSALEEWEMSRLLVKSDSILPVQKEQTSRALVCFSSVEIHASRFLPDGVDWFVLPNSNKVVCTELFLERIKRFIDDWAGAQDLETVS